MHNGKFLSALIIIVFGLIGIFLFVQTAPQLSFAFFVMGWVISITMQTMTGHSKKLFDWWFHGWNI